MPIFKRQVNSYSDFSSFFSVITYNSSLSLQLMRFLLWTKRSYENTNFEVFKIFIFKCSDENLPNSSCHFPNNKSVFLQIYMTLQLHDSTLYTLLKRDQSKCKFFYIYILPSKVAYQSTNLVKFHLSSKKSEIL